MIASSDALGNMTNYKVDALGRQIQVSDPLGQLTTQAYDAAGRLSSVTDPLTHVTTYAYDAAGRRAGVTDALGHTTTNAFDAAGRMVSSTDALTRKIQFAYDALGRLTSTTLPSGLTTTYGYDAVGRQTSVKDPLGNTGTYSFDAVGRRISSTDPLNKTTAYAYDAAGRLTAITDPLGGKVTIGFDAAGQQTSVVNPRGETTSFSYDGLGNVATLTNPGGKLTTMTYDAAGRLTSKLNARGISVTYGYDAAGRQTSTVFPGGSIGATFDALGRRTSMTDPTGATTFAYDAASNLTAVTAPQGAVSYAYDAANRRTSMTLPGSRTVAYSYDAANQLTGLTDWLGQTTTMSYTADGQRSRVTRPAGITTTFGYDGADRLTSLNNDGASGALKDFSYTLDAAGNRTSATSAAGTERYVLDALSRLTQVSYPNADQVSYTYDAAGNRLTQTVNGTTTSYGYNAAGQLQTVGATTYSYDADGNLIGAGADSFAWDWAGRLSGATVGGANSTYTYDGDGVRVAAKAGSSATTNYLWDRQASLPLLVDDGIHGYVHSSGVSEQLDAGGTSTAVYPLTDALGSVRGLANTTGTVVGGTDYDAFGAPRSTNGTSSIFGFTGQQTDPTNLLYLRSRYLNTGLGRFISPDSLFPNAAGTQGYNYQAYVANNPVSRTDPSGHTFAEFAFQVVRAAVIVAATALVLYALIQAVRVDSCLLGAVAVCPPGVYPPRAPRIPAGGAGASAADEIASGMMRSVATLTRAAAVAAAAACLASAVAGRLAPWGSNPCSGAKGPIFFSMNDNPQTTQHIYDAQTGANSIGIKPAILTYWQSRPDPPTPWLPTSWWYNATPMCNDGAHAQFLIDSKGDLGICDEYPFRSTRQNQENVATVSLRLVRSGEGPIQGGALSKFYGPAGCKVPNGGEFAVVSVVAANSLPVMVPSFGWCPAR
jgi:RHS repeat-associated protein